MAAAVLILISLGNDRSTAGRCVSLGVSRGVSLVGMTRGMARRSNVLWISARLRRVSALLDRFGPGETDPKQDVVRHDQVARTRQLTIYVKSGLVENCSVRLVQTAR